MQFILGFQLVGGCIFWGFKFQAKIAFSAKQGFPEIYLETSLVLHYFHALIHTNATQLWREENTNIIFKPGAEATMKLNSVIGETKSRDLDYPIRVQ